MENTFYFSQVIYNMTGEACDICMDLDNVSCDFNEEIGHWNWYHRFRIIENYSESTLEDIFHVLIWNMYAKIDPHYLVLPIHCQIVELAR